MKPKTSASLIVLFAGLALAGCNRDIPDRVETTSPNSDLATVPASSTSGATQSADEDSVEDEAPSTTESEDQPVATEVTTDETSTAAVTPRSQDKSQVKNKKQAKKSHRRKSKTPSSDYRRSASSGSVSAVGVGGQMTSEPGRPSGSEMGSTSGTTTGEATGGNMVAPTPDRVIESDRQTDPQQNEASRSGSSSDDMTRHRSANQQCPPTASGAKDCANQVSRNEFMNERDWDANNPAKALEPQSRAPDRTGSTSITGVPRSHAQAGRPTIFTDPSLMPLQDISPSHPGSASGMTSSMNLGRYAFVDRDAFKEDMNDRLENFETRLRMMRIQVNESTARNQREFRPLLDQVNTKYEAAERNLDQAESVVAHQWNRYKTGFRDQLADLERSYESLRTAMNSR